MVVSLPLYNPFVTVIALVLAGSLIGFLRYNFNPASIFLGDSGALFVGFTLAALAVQGTQKASTVVAIVIPLLAFGVPMVDTGFTMVRRFISGRPLFEGDREHIHHMLLSRGWSQRRVAFVLYGACALFGLMAMLFVGEAGRTTGLILFVVGVAVVLAVGRLRYHEIDEIKASVKRNIGNRRVRAANNLRIRRAARSMSEAKTLREFFEAVELMLELGEFVYVVAGLGCGGDGARNERVLEREKKTDALHRAELRGDFIQWTWERGDVTAAEVVGSEQFWTLRLPLSTERAVWGYINLYRALDSRTLMFDINYLCHLFQREMAQAAERILSADEREALAEVLPQVAEARK
jgi:UDP-GlcNAc:undecaprenyl-phosphate GlcNAc-1-phosphate transferase